jgi:MFS family permease
MFPVILIPACLGLGVLSLGTAPGTAFVYLALVGGSQGIASPMMTAVWAEVYGVETLGATKSTVAMLGIFGTALGPLLLGGLLKAGVRFDVIIPTCAILGMVAVGVSLLARSRLRAENAENGDL